MKAEYDLSKMKSRRNPYAAKLKKPVSMRLSEDVVDYFKGMADEAGVPNALNLSATRTCATCFDTMSTGISLIYKAMAKF